jgi:hypothetical protein
MDESIYNFRSRKKEKPSRFTGLMWKWLKILSGIALGNMSERAGIIKDSAIALDTLPFRMK